MHWIGPLQSKRDDGVAATGHSLFITMKSITLTFERPVVKRRGGVLGLWDVSCHTWFLCRNQVLIVCMTQDQLFHTYDQKCSLITICHK
jgi:hypothetical protein